jgi:hypothetical protein
VAHVLLKKFGGFGCCCSVVNDGDIKAAAGFGIEETIETIGFHKLGMSENDYMQLK